METVRYFIFSGSKITADGDCSHEIKTLSPWKKAMTNLESILKSRDFTLPAKIYIIKVMVFLVVMYGCESWTINKAESWRADNFWTVVLEKTPKSPLDCKEIKPVNPQGNQPWILLMLKLKLQYSGHLMQKKNDSLEKTLPDAGKDWGQEEMGTTEDEKVGLHHQLNGHEFDQVWASKGVGDGQESLVCYSPWGRKESDMAEWLSNNDNCFLNDDTPVW